MGLAWGNGNSLCCDYDVGVLVAFLCLIAAASWICHGEGDLRLLYLLAQLIREPDCFFLPVEVTSLRGHRDTFPRCWQTTQSWLGLLSPPWFVTKDILCNFKLNTFNFGLKQNPHQTKQKNLLQMCIME